MPEPAYRDRSRRLVALGVVVIGCGLAGLFLGLTHLLFPLVEGRLPSAAGLDKPALLMGAMLYGSLGAILVWIGIGSVRLQRWVRPLMLSLAWIWLITGLVAAPLVASMTDDLVRLATAEMDPLPPALVAAVKLLVLSFTVVAGVIFPALLVWAYRDPDVGRTCEARHAQPAWTDRCPLGVLGLSVGLGLAALVALPLVLRPAVPLFGLLVTGRPGSLLVLGGVAFTAWLARSTFRLQPGGWWATTAALIALGASTVVTLGMVDPVEIYRAMGYPDEVLAAWSGSPATGRAVLIGGTVALTVASLVYMARIRVHFSAGVSPETAPSHDRSRSGSPRSGSRAPRLP